METMFPGREVMLKCYKLAIYEVKGHFNSHMDLMHSDSHHAILLVGLNTFWKGGTLRHAQSSSLSIPTFSF